MRFFIHLITFLLSSLLSLSTVGLAILAGLYFIYSPQLPKSEDLRKIDIQVPLRIYSRDERLIAEYGEKRSRPVNFNAIPERLRQAFIAIEDARYYEHQGIDLDLRWAEDVLASLVRVWKRPVEIHTTAENKPTLLRFDGKDHVKRAR